MPPSKRNQLRYYNERLAKNTTPFPCVFCKVLVQPKAYEKHCTESHDLNSKLCCVWCGGKISWSGRRKKHYVDHLVQCFHKFVALAFPDLATLSEGTGFNLTPLCEARSFLHFERIPDLPDRAYEDCWLLPLDPLSIPLQDENLNLAASCVRKYSELEADWYHVMVRAVAIPSFLAALDEDDGKTRTLPFSCFCDGGLQREARYRQHKHVILVTSPKGRYKQTNWSRRIRPTDKPKGRGKFDCLKSIAIESRLHLIQLLGYVSHRKSICCSSGNQNNHFWIARSLCVDYKLALAVQYDNGLKDLIQHEFRNIHPKKLLGAPMELIDTRYQIKVADLPGVRLNVILPVSREFLPCREEETIHFLHLNQGRKLYFKISAMPENWEKVQSEGGNVFYHAVGNDWIAPHRNAQISLECAKPVMERSAELKVKLESSQQENRVLRREIGAKDCEIANLKATIHRTSVLLKSARHFTVIQM